MFLPNIGGLSWLLEDVFHQAYEDTLTEKLQQNLSPDVSTNINTPEI